MKKLSILLMVMFVGLSAAFAKNEEQSLDYQVKGAGPSNNGTAYVNVTIVSKKKENVTEALLGRAAVHAVLFREYTTQTAIGNSGLTSTTAHKPLMKSPIAETKHAEFFQPFFNDGMYQSYVQVISDSRRTVKMGKEYKVSCDVSVSETQLKQDLKDAGIYGGLGAGL